MRRTSRTCLPLVLAIVLLPVGFLVHIGYMGGTVFTVFPGAKSPAASERGLTALFLSSDMGLKLGMGAEIANRLSADGIPVVGVNSLTYFRTRRTPAEADVLLIDGMRRARAMAGTHRLLLIGQSFGADILQASLARLPQEERRDIAIVVLIVPPDTTMYRASPSEIFDFGQKGIPAGPTARRLDWVPTLCVQGTEEEDSLCPQMRSPNVIRIALPGGHMLNFDPDRLYAAVAPHIRRTAAMPPRTRHYR